MKKIVLPILITGSLTFGTLIGTLQPVFADEYDNKIEEKNATIDGLKSKEADVEKQVAELQAQVNEISTKAQDLLNKQTNLRNASANLTEEIKQLNKRIERRQEAIQKQARNVQVNGSSTNYMDTLLNAESISDAITRVQAMATIVGANNDLVKQQQEDKKEVEIKKAENDKKMQEIQKNQVVLERQKGELEKAQVNLRILQTDLAAQRATAEGEKSSLQKQKAEAEKERERIEAQEKALEEVRKVQTTTTQRTTTQTTTNTQNNTEASDSGDVDVPVYSEPEAPSEQPSTPPGSGNNNTDTPDQGEDSNNAVPAPSGVGAAVVAEAQKHIGKSYVWGGKGPTVFDCSGFTSYVYRQATGREIGGYTGAQESAGVMISVAEAQAGDLYFWGSPGGTYHVAIATGGGGYIHAGNESTGVCYGSVGGSFTPSFALRM